MIKVNILRCYEHWFNILLSRKCKYRHFYIMENLWKASVSYVSKRKNYLNLIAYQEAISNDWRQMIRSWLYFRKVVNQNEKMLIQKSHYYASNVSSLSAMSTNRMEQGCWETIIIYVKTLITSSSTHSIIKDFIFSY